MVEKIKKEIEEENVQASAIVSLMQILYSAEKEINISTKEISSAKKKFMT